MFFSLDSGSRYVSQTFPAAVAIAAVNKPRRNYSIDSILDGSRRTAFCERLLAPFGTIRAAIS